MKKVLVVINMQNDFVTGSLGTKEAEKIVPVVAEKIRLAVKKGYRVYATMDTHFEVGDEAYYETQEGRRLPVLHCRFYTWGWELVDEIVKVLPSRTRVWRKYTFGSMKAMESVKRFVEEDGVEEVEFCGLCTDISVMANVALLKTLAPEVKIVVDSKACAGMTPAKHEAALEVMRSLQVDVL